MDNQKARKLKSYNLGVKYIQIKSLTNFTKRDFMFLIKAEQFSTLVFVEAKMFLRGRNAS